MTPRRTELGAGPRFELAAAVERPELVASAAAATGEPPTAPSWSGSSSTAALRG